LLQALKYFGSQGSASSAIHVMEGLDIGKGSVLNYVNCSVSAISYFQKRSIFRPSAPECVEISRHFKEQFFLPRLVGTVDGTHLGLTMKPSLHGRDYFTQKSKYATVVNDDKHRI
jgi:hypothetical protein